MASMVLFEHASGYALFRVKEFEEVSALQAEVEATVSDVSAFNGVVNLVAFCPFTSAVDALDNINAVSEGTVTDMLAAFVESNLPKKLKKFVLGVGDPKLGGALAERTYGSAGAGSGGLRVTHVGAVPEILRGVRTHFAKLVKGLTDQGSCKAQLGLGHAYSRAKVKFNVNKSDNMIIQSIALLDQLDKDVNTFSMRIREWYSYHFPELARIVNDNHLFARCVKLVKNRKEFLRNLDSDDPKEAEAVTRGLEEVLVDSAKVRAVVEAAKSSMGMDISFVDLLNIEMFACRVIALAEYRSMVANYLQDKMAMVAPNLATLIGDSVAARLISHAGSLTNLAKYPASTVQILGAEKALFRALKTKGNTPKYGLIFHSTFIGRAGAKNKGRISRFLANKCSIASRIDCFSDVSTRIFGEKLKDQVEARLKFYETGEVPKKNVEVMQEALEAIKAEASSFQEVKSKKKKKDKKRKAEEMMEGDNDDDAAAAKSKLNGQADATNGLESPTKKKKPKIKEENGDDSPSASVANGAAAANQATPSTDKKKKKKKKNDDD